MSFLSTVEALSEEVPSSWNYSPSNIQRKDHSNWRKAKDYVFKEKDIVGPGYYETVAQGKIFTLPSVKKYKFPKSKSPDVLSERALITKDFPGVGNYPEADKINSIGSLFKSASPKINHISKTGRYIEDIIKLGSRIPGPGAYNIGLQIKANKSKKV